ncbi:hypothetical protein D3C86_851810 [compost metagenome]
MKNLFTTTNSRFGIIDDFFQYLRTDLTFGHRFIFHEFCQFLNIFLRIESQTITIAPIAASTASFLVVAFHRFWNIMVDNITDIRFVNPHTKGDCRNNHFHILHQEFILRIGPCFSIKTCMVWQRFNTVQVQHLAYFFNFLSAQAINNTSFARFCLDKTYNFFDHVFFGTYLII